MTANATIIHAQEGWTGYKVAVNIERTYYVVTDNAGIPVYVTESEDDLTDWWLQELQH